MASPPPEASSSAGQLSQPKLVSEGSGNEMPAQLKQHNHQPEQESQPHSQNHQQQAETNSFQLAEKETGYAGIQSFVGSKVDMAQTSGDPQHAKQTTGQQAPPAAQDARKRAYQPSIPFNMLIPILQAHLDRDKDMQLQDVWAKLRRNEVNKDNFLKIIRNIVGDQMLKQAAHNVFAQMQANAQRNSQANVNQQTNANQYSLPSQVSSSGSAQLHDQQDHMSSAPNQGQKSQASSSSQAFVPSSIQVQSSMAANDNSIQQPVSKGMHAMPNRPLAINSESEIKPSLHPHGTVPAKIGTAATHPSMQHNATGKARPVGTGGSSMKLQGKQVPPNTSTPPTTRANKKSAGQKKSLETGSTPPPPSKKQKTSGTTQEQSIDQLNDVTAVSGVNLR
ncbi:hypothetical protein GUJ93_ZPchr0002g26415, partial [Zizania palustris]